MSCVVRQEWATFSAHSQGLLVPHSHMLNTMGRPALVIALRIVMYASFALTFWVAHQSYFT